MNKRNLTVKQKEVLEFIDAYQKEHKIIPTLVEMSQKFGVTIPAIQHRISALSRKKLIVRENIYKILSPAVGAPSATNEVNGISSAEVEDFK